MYRAVVFLVVVCLLAACAADTSFDVLVDTRVRYGTEYSSPVVGSSPSPRRVRADGVRVEAGPSHTESHAKENHTSRLQRMLSKHTEAHGNRKLLATSDPLQSATMLVPGLIPTVDTETKQPTVDAWFFVQRGVQRTEEKVDQLLIHTADDGLKVDFVNSRAVLCGEDISNECGFTIRVVFEPTCHDITAFGMETFSNVVFCQQRVTFTPVETTSIVRSIGATVVIDIAKVVPTLGLRMNTTLTARLHYVDEPKLSMTPITLPDVHLHFSSGREALLDPLLLTQSTPDFFVEGEDVCTILTATSLPHPATGMITATNVDLVEVAMCTKTATVLAWELPVGSQQDPSFSCMAYDRNSRVSVIYSQRFSQCAGSNRTGSRLGGCCDPLALECAVADALNTRFQCTDDATGDFSSGVCSMANAPSFTGDLYCPVGSSCGNPGDAPLTLFDAPVHPSLFPLQCLNAAATAMVDCSTDTTGCTHAAACTPATNRVAFCMKIPTFEPGMNHTAITYEFRLNITVVDSRHEQPQGQARRLLEADSRMVHRTVTATKSISIISKAFYAKHPLAKHWMHTLAEEAGVDAETFLATLPFVALGLAVVVAIGGIFVIVT